MFPYQVISPLSTSDLPPQWYLNGASERGFLPQNPLMLTDALSPLSDSHTGRLRESRSFSDIYGGLSEVLPLPPATPLPARNLNDNDSNWGVWHAVSERGEPNVMNSVERCDKETEQETDEAGSENQKKPAEKAANRWHKRRRTADQHSLCERNRRTRIQEKLKTLQQMVPNTSQLTQSSILEETINHIKGLQLFLRMSGAQNIQPTQCYSPYMPAMPSPAGMGGWPLSPAMGAWLQMPGAGLFPFLFPFSINVPNFPWNPCAANTSGKNPDPGQSSEPPPCTTSIAANGNLGSRQSSQPPPRDTTGSNRNLASIRPPTRNTTGSNRNPGPGQSSEPPPSDTPDSNRNIGSGQSSKPPPRATNASNRTLGSGQSCQPPSSDATGSNRNLGSRQPFKPPPCDTTGSRRSLGSGQSFKPPPCDTTGSHRSLGSGQFFESPPCDTTGSQRNLGSYQSFEPPPFHNIGSNNNPGSGQSLELPSAATIVSGRSLGSGQSYKPPPCDITDSSISQSFKPPACNLMTGSHGTLGSVQPFAPPPGDIIGSNENLGSRQSFQPPPCDNIDSGLNLGLCEYFGPLPSGGSGSCTSPISFQSSFEQPRCDKSDSGRYISPLFYPEPQLCARPDFRRSLGQHEPYEPPPDDTGGSFRSLTHVNPSNHSATSVSIGSFGLPQSSLQPPCKTNSSYGSLDPSLKSLEQLSATDVSYINFFPNLSPPPYAPESFYAAPIQSVPFFQMDQ